MTATFLSNLALGTISLLMSQIIAFSGWVQGSSVLQGHLFWDNTNVTNTEYVGLQPIVKHKASGYDFISNGTQTGSVIQANAVVVNQTVIIPCTNTGGIASYDTCILANPLNKTGSIVGLQFGCGLVQRSFTMSGSFVKSRKTSATAASFPGFGTKSYGTGSNMAAALFGQLFRAGSGQLIWNRDDFIKFQVGTTAIASADKLNNCQGRVEFFDANIR